MDFLHKRLLIDIIGFLLTSGGALGIAYLVRKSLSGGTIAVIVIISFALYAFDFFNYKKRNNL